MSNDPRDARGEQDSRVIMLLGRARARVLAALHEPRSTEQVARQVGAAISTTSEHLNALARAGLAVRQRRRRIVFYELSDRGRRLLEVLASDDLPGARDRARPRQTRDVDK
jgi:DNA-binding transcriptional ArsR family regulator